MAARGRSYAPDVEASIRAVGDRLDELAGASVPLFINAGVELSDAVRDVNAHLVNEVIIDSDTISDAEAVKRLAAIDAELQALRPPFAKHGIEIQAYVPASKEEVAQAVPMEKAGRLSTKLHEAWDRFIAVVDRYAKVRPQLEDLKATPVAGGATSAILTDFDRKLNAADADIFFAQEFIAQLDERIRQGGDSVEILGSTFTRLENWIQGVFMADQSLVRLEGLLNGSPAAYTTPSWGGIPWWGFVVAGVVTLGAVCAIASATSSSRDAA